MGCSVKGGRARPAVPYDERRPQLRVRMHRILKYCLFATVGCLSASAPAAERVLNLKEIAAHAVLVTSNRALAVLTAAAPHVLDFTNSAPRALVRWDQPAQSKKVQITYGRDIVGFANVRIPDRNPKATMVSIDLTFEAAEQAAAAALALQPAKRAPSPIQKRKGDR